MLANERHARIVEMTDRQGSVTVQELVDALETSESTIRRDLEKLDAAHRVARVHGGAMSLESAHVTRDLTMNERAGLHTEEKLRIVSHASTIIRPEDFVYVDGGSTMLLLVEQIEERDATYVTDSMTSALKLVERGFHAVVIGGELKSATEALVGPEALDAIDRYHFTVGFWGTNGIDLDLGLTTPDRYEAQVKRASIQHTEASRRYVLTDASKFGRVAPVSFAALDDVTILTDSIPDDEFRAHGNIREVPA